MQPPIQHSFYPAPGSGIQGEEGIFIPTHSADISLPVIPDLALTGPSRTMELTQQAEQLICRTDTCAQNPRVFKRPGELRYEPFTHIFIRCTASVSVCVSNRRPHLLHT